MSTGSGDGLAQGTLAAFAGGGGGVVFAPFQVLQEQLRGGQVVHQSAEEIIRLETLQEWVWRLPVWPTDTRILAQLFLSIAFPLGLIFLQVVVEKMLGK